MTYAASFDVLYAEHAPAARRLALSLVPGDVADDIVSEAFVRVIAAVRRGASPVSFRPYLFTVIRNQAWAYVRERHRLVLVADPEPPAAPGAGELAVRREELAMVTRAFAALPQRWQFILWQTEVEGHQPASLSERTGLSPNAVAQLAVRARVGLSQAWERERGPLERDTGPLPALQRLAARRKLRYFS
jgi:RNA polymerase sigma factor (sigma-70 family)